MARQFDVPGLKALGLSPSDFGQQSGSSGGSFLSHEVARVDPSGNDSTGTVGDLSKPFLTVQGAINALEAGSFIYPLIDIGNNDCVEDLTTTLTQFGIRSVAGVDDHYAFRSLTASGSLTLSLSHCFSNADGNITADGNLSVYLHDAGLNGPAISTTGAVILKAASNVFGTYGGYISDVTAHTSITIYGVACQGQLTSDTSGDISITDSPFLGQYCIIDSTGSNVFLTRALVYRVKTGVNSVTLKDARVTFQNLATTTTYADQLLTKIVFPDADPHVAGAGYWVAGVLTKSAG